MQYTLSSNLPGLSELSASIKTSISLSFTSRARGENITVFSCPSPQTFFRTVTRTCVLRGGISTVDVSARVIVVRLADVVSWKSDVLKFNFCWVEEYRNHSKINHEEDAKLSIECECRKWKFKSLD